jgi:hypothetical protein
MSLWQMEMSGFEMETPPPPRHGSPGGPGGSPGVPGSLDSAFRHSPPGVREFRVSWHDQPVPEVTGGIHEVPETPPPHQGGYGSPSGSRGVTPLADHESQAVAEEATLAAMPGNTGYVQTGSDVARMERLAAGEARASKVKEKRAPEAALKKLADAAEKRKNDRKRDILKTGQRQQLSNHKAGKVSKRPAGKVCKKTPEGEEEFQGSGDDFQASEVPSTQSSSSSCLPTAAGLSQITGKGKGRGRGKGKGKSQGVGKSKGKGEGEGHGQDESNGRAEAKAKAKATATGCFFGHRPPKGAVALQAFNELVDFYYTVQRQRLRLNFTNEVTKGRSFWDEVHAAEDRPAAIKAWVAKHRIAPTKPAEPQVADSGLVEPQGPEVANQEEGKEEGNDEVQQEEDDKCEEDACQAEEEAEQEGNAEGEIEEEEEAWCETASAAEEEAALKILYPSENKDDDEPGKDIS